MCLFIFLILYLTLEFPLYVFLDFCAWGDLLKFDIEGKIFGIIIIV